MKQRMIGQNGGMLSLFSVNILLVHVLLICYLAVLNLVMMNLSRFYLRQIRDLNGNEIIVIITFKLVMSYRGL